jgi:hypothetical protein
MPTYEQERANAIGEKRLKPMLDNVADSLSSGRGPVLQKRKLLHRRSRIGDVKQRQV